MNDSTWTWIAGTHEKNALGKYGKQGVPDPANMPGGRDDGFGWYDSSTQEFWLFGGWGYATSSERGT